MQFNITFKTIFEYVLKKLVLCIQIRFVSTEKTTRIASPASCFYSLRFFTSFCHTVCDYRTPFEGILHNGVKIKRPILTV